MLSHDFQWQDLRCVARCENQVCGDFLQEAASSRLPLAPKLSKMWWKPSTIFLSVLLCRLDHRHYLLECPHKYSVADLRQVRAFCMVVGVLLVKTSRFLSGMALHRHQ